jgi:hypothetical protein
MTSKRFLPLILVLLAFAVLATGSYAAFMAGNFAAYMASMVVGFGLFGLAEAVDR